MKKPYFYIAGLLILVVILLLVFTQMPKNQEMPQEESNLEIYDDVDSSVDDYLTQSQPENQRNNVHDAVDDSVELFLNN